MHEAKRIARHVAHAKAGQEKPSMEELLAKGDYDGLKLLKVKELSALCKEIGQPTYGKEKIVRRNPPKTNTHIPCNKSAECMSCPPYSILFAKGESRTLLSG